jgi:hypothetical protein
LNVKDVERLTVTELADEYEHQYEILNSRIEGLRPLLYVYKGEDLYLLRRRIKTYYDMAVQCKIISRTLGSYYEAPDDGRLH